MYSAPQLAPPLRTDPPMRTVHSRRWRLLAIVGALGLTAAAYPIITNLTLVATLHEPAAEHLDQADLLALVQQGPPGAAFAEAFEHGDELFETVFNALDGVGANVGQGQRFTRVPRADLNGPHEWANHFPARATGPNAQACNQRHSQPAHDARAPTAANVHRDPLHSGNIGRFIQRNTPHTFAPGAIQRLAEEMTTALEAIREQLAAQVQQTGRNASATLRAKGVEFGTLRASLVRGSVVFDTRGVEGVDADLVIKPFQWKGSVKFIRDFNRGAGHNELGMQADEIVGDDVDGDGDNVVDEFTIGDMTALAVYLAAQPRPTSKVELSQLGLIPALTQAEI